MQRALITGNGGFVGVHLERAARAEGFEVVGLDKSPLPGVDLLDMAQVREVVARARPDVVLHLAGLLRAEDPVDLYLANIAGTVNLLEALVREDLKPRVVVASSSAVYGSPIDNEPLSESRALAPLTHYAASKAAQEVVALRFHTAHSLPVVVARAFNIIGPGQPSTLAAGAFAEQVARAERSSERRMKVGDLSAERDFVDVRDVACAYLRLAKAGVPGETYNVCSGVGTPVQRCVDELLALARVPITLERDPARARPHEVKSQVGSRQRISADLGWVPEVSFERSIRDLLESWRMRVALEGGAQ